MPREQLVEPSTGSITTVIDAPSRSWTPDSSLTIRTGALLSTAHAASSATRSSAYWPERSVRAAQLGAIDRGDGVAHRDGSRIEELEQRVGSHATGITSTTAL